MEVCTNGASTKFTKLPLDLSVPLSVLERRGAISFSSGFTQSVLPRFERRGGISYDRADKKAQYLRMLGDVKLRSRKEYAPPVDQLTADRRTSLSAADLHLIRECQGGSSHFPHGRRFLSVRRVRHKRPLLKVSRDNASAIDDQYALQAQRLLSTVGDWSFNVFNLDKLTNGRALFHMSLRLFQEYDLLHSFQLDIVKLMKCITMIEDGYHSNPYHNAVHAADVTQAMHCYLKEKLISSQIRPLEILASLLASIAHDLDHPGVNQTFLIKTSNHLAALYDNGSVLENHHFRSVFGILHESELLSHLTRQEWDEVIWQVKSLILATDMTRQQEFYTRFKTHLDKEDLDISVAGHRHFVLQIAIKCADISNPCRNWKESSAWSERVCEEFFQQGDLERSLHLPVTNNCDRHATTVAKVQAGFMEYVVAPLFKEWQRLLPTHLSQHMMMNIQRNKLTWTNLVHEWEKENQIGQSTQETNSAPPGSRHSNSSSTSSNRSENSGGSGIANMDDVETEVAEVAERLEEALQWRMRRHSLPNSILRREFPQLYVRRGSFPTTVIANGKRRRSLPKTNSLQAVSYDRVVEKLSSHLIRHQQSAHTCSNDIHCVSVDSIVTRPKISTLTPSVATSLLTSPVTWAQSGHCGVQTKPMLAVLAVGGHIYRVKGQTFPAGSRPILAELATNNNNHIAAGRGSHILGRSLDSVHNCPTRQLRRGSGSTTEDVERFQTLRDTPKGNPN